MKSSEAWKRAACLQLMFQTERVTPSSKRYLKYSTVAKALGLSYGKVYHICTTALTNKNKKKVSWLLFTHADLLLRTLCEF